MRLLRRDGPGPHGGAQPIGGDDGTTKPAPPEMFGQAQAAHRPIATGCGRVSEALTVIAKVGRAVSTTPAVANY